jgi:hypothetical protein
MSDEKPRKWRLRMTVRVLMIAILVIAWIPTEGVSANRMGMLIIT